MKYRIVYRIAASVSRYISYREVLYRCTPTRKISENRVVPMITSFHCPYAQVFCWYVLKIKKPQEKNTNED